MPRIPDASQLGYSIPQTRTPRFQDQSGEIVANAAGRLAGTIGQVANVLQEREDKFSYAQAKSTLLQADIEARRALENDSDWGTYEQRYSEIMGKAREKAVGFIRSNNDRALFDMDAKLDVERGIGEVRGLAKRKEVDMGRAGIASMLESARTTALEAPDEATRSSIRRNVQDALEGAVQRGYLSRQERVSQDQSWSASYADGFVDIQPLDKQIEILSKPEGTPAALLAPDRRANLLTQAKNAKRLELERAEAERKSRLIEVRQSLSDQLRDVQTGAMLGLPVSVPSKGVLQAAFGEREGAQRYDFATKAAKLSGDVASLHQLPMADMDARVESYRPTTSEGSADQAQLYGVLANSAEKIKKSRIEDPAGYLTQFAPKTQSAWQQFEQEGTPEARDAYLAAVDADRERLGLPKGDVLPNSYAKELAEEIANPKSAEQLASLMEAEAQRWGVRWPDVHSQIAKDIPDMAAVIGSGIDRSAAVTLASTAKLKEAELKSMLPPSVKWGDVQDEVASKFDEVRRSFPAEGARTYQAISDSAMRLAVSYMQGGASKSNAIDRAYKDLVGNQYNVATVKSVPFLVPRQFDADDVEDEAEKQIAEFRPSPDMISVPAGVDPGPLVERATKRLRDDAYWVARGDGKGLRLYLGARPTAVTYEFSQLAEMAQVRKASERAKIEREQAMRARAGQR